MDLSIWAALVIEGIALAGGLIAAWIAMTNRMTRVETRLEATDKAIADNDRRSEERWEKVDAHLLRIEAKMDRLANR